MSAENAIVTAGKIAAQINPLIAAAVGIISTIRAVRDAAKMTNPDGTYPSDAELIGELLSSAKLGQKEAAEMQAWLATLPK